MKLYNCSVRLAGNINHTVPKASISESEILVLRHIHGNDSVVAIKSSKDESDASKKQELVRLAAIYGKDVIEGLFKIPLDLDTIVVEQSDDDEELPPEFATAADEQATVPAKKKAA